MPTQIAFVARPFAGEADLPAITALLNRVAAADGLDESYGVDDLRNEFSDPDLDPARDLRLWEDPAGRFAGFGQLWIARSGEPLDGGLYFRVDPAARDTGIPDEIITWAEARLREAGRERGVPVVVRGWARESEAFTRSVLERHGMRVVRYFFRMGRPLDQPIPEPVFPAGFTLRHVEDDADVEHWVEMFNQSFVDHWNHHPRTVESHRHWLQNSHYRREHDLIAVAPDGTFAAFCFCLIDAGANAREGKNEGWIDVLGTRRGFRQIGLGRAMLLAGMQRLKADGVALAVLGVDAENPTGALRLYESVGFTRLHQTTMYSKDFD